MLAEIRLPPNSSTEDCPATSLEPFICWDAVGATFAGTARSISIVTLFQRVMLLDNLTFGSAVPIVKTVPEPATLLLLGCGVAGVAVRMRRRRA